MANESLLPTIKELATKRNGTDRDKAARAGMAINGLVSTRRRDIIALWPELNADEQSAITPYLTAEQPASDFDGDDHHAESTRTEPKVVDDGDEASVTLDQDPDQVS